LPSDIYALGIILSELLFKKYPFERFAEGEDVVNQRPIFPADGLHGDLIPAVHKCFDRDTRKRPTAGSLLWTLNKSREGHGSKTEAGANNRPASRSKQNVKPNESGGRGTFAAGGAAKSKVRVATQTRVQVLQNGFDHSYYSDTTLTRRHFVGSSVSAEEKGGEVICINLEIVGSKVYITNLCEGLTFSVGPSSNVRQLSKGERAEVGSGDYFEIGGTGFFSAFKRKHGFQIEVSA
jgi:serine/threonine protein kinase